MPGQRQIDRLTKQHRKSHGELGIFGDKARDHDSLVAKVEYEAALDLKGVSEDERHRCCIL